MNTIILLTVLATGLSESIETRLPEDPQMIYTVAFQYNGVKIGLDWKDRQIVPDRTCRKAAAHQKLQCQQAAASWLSDECRYYEQKSRLTNKQRNMRDAVCQGADSVSELVSAGRLANRI